MKKYFLMLILLIFLALLGILQLALAFKNGIHLRGVFVEKVLPHSFNYPKELSPGDRLTSVMIGKKEFHFFYLSSLVKLVCPHAGEIKLKAISANGEMKELPFVDLPLIYLDPVLYRPTKCHFPNWIEWAEKSPWRKESPGVGAENLKISQLKKENWAYEIGLRSSDIIKSVNGFVIFNEFDFMNKILQEATLNKPVHVVWERPGAGLMTQIVPKEKMLSVVGRGISFLTPPLQYASYFLFQSKSLTQSLDDTVSYVKESLAIIKDYNSSSRDLKTLIEIIGLSQNPYPQTFYSLLIFYLIQLIAFAGMILIVILMVLRLLSYLWTGDATASRTDR